MKRGYHYWRRPLCRGPEALGKGPLTLGKELSGNFESAKRVFAEGPLSGTRQSLAEGWTGTRQKKAAVTASALGTESLPRAVSGGPRQRIILFFKLFAEGLQPWPSAKKCAEFFQKIFAEGSGTALGKELFFFF